jgi:serine/threonine protein kinase
LKENARKRNGTKSKQSSSKVFINGGTACYQAPELFGRNAKFSRKADVFAAGVIFLELLTLQGPSFLYDDLFPGVLECKLPAALLKCLSSSLATDPENRTQFAVLLDLLKSPDGNAIKELGLNSPTLNLAGDICLLMPSSQNSRGREMNSFEQCSSSSFSSSMSSSATSSTPTTEPKKPKRWMFFK